VSSTHAPASCEATVSPRALRSAYVAKARRFYGDVLGLSHDPGRPEIPTIDGYWMDVGGTAQIHLMGVEGQSKFAKGPGKDPSLPHVALAVADIQAATPDILEVTLLPI